VLDRKPHPSLGDGNIFSNEDFLQPSVIRRFPRILHHQTDF